MNETIPKKTMFLVPPIPLVEETKDKDEKPNATDVIEFLLKQRAGSTATAPTYKLKVTRFCEGTVSEWITFRKAIAELWLQNGITSAYDKISSISTILRGDSLTGFEEKIEELTTSIDDDGETVTIALTDETVEEGLNAVAQMVFPFRALETQKQWMRRRMRKPKELPIRKTVAAVGRLNNSLPLFPSGKESDKFTPGEILEILEWSIPESWRAKFDLAGYVPTEFTKERFMTECKAIERNEPKHSSKNTNSATSGKTETHKKSHGVKHRSVQPKNDTNRNILLYQTRSESNSYHRQVFHFEKPCQESQGSFSFREEINFLAKQRPKKKILEMFAVVLEEEQQKLNSKNAKKIKKKIILDESSDSENENMSVEHMSIADTDKSPSETVTDETDEDKTYQSRIENLGTITYGK